MTSCQVTDLAKPSGWPFQHRKGLCRRTHGSATGTGPGYGYGPLMGTTSEEPVGTQLLVGDADTELKAVLSAGLEAYNTAAIDAGEQSELSVKVVAEDGSVVAGLAGWTWGTCAGISLVWVRRTHDGKVGAANCSPPRSGSLGSAAASRSSSRLSHFRRRVSTSFTGTWRPAASRAYRWPGRRTCTSASSSSRTTEYPRSRDAHVAVGDPQRGSSIVSEPSTVPITWKPCRS